ncbi:MAG: DUF4097 domain-containing protein [Firmicutes bacterium]|jgi:DUF4097 and DUF4098 domain-containing protein YvlB|nr:DUF4097 domain-containing protein [Bacillota bacterium]
MREEIVMILKMLEEGKITSEQAVLLIEAVDEAVGLHTPQESPLIPERDEEKPEQSEPPVSLKKPDMTEVRDLADKLSGLADVVDRAALENLAERIRETVESAVKSTDRTIGRMQREMRDRRRSTESAGDIPAASWHKAIIEPFQRMFSPGLTVEKVVEGSFSGESGKKIDVELSTWNGRIIVEPWDEPGFRVDVTANVMPGAESQTPGDAGEALLKELLKCDVADDSLKIKLSHGRGVSGASFNVKLPRKFLYDMNLETQNGRVSLGEFEYRMITVKTSNGRIDLDNTRGAITELETSNGRINVSGVTQRLSARTSNGGITIEARGIMGESQYELTTSNGAIEVQVADADKVGYHIDAKTSLGRIALDLPNLAYQVRDEGTVRREVITETSGFSKNADRLTIKARTSNGQVRIVRSQ